MRRLDLCLSAAALVGLAERFLAPAIADGIARADFGMTLLVSAALSAVALVASELLYKPPKVKPDAFGKPTSIEGRPWPLVFGRCRVNAPNVMWWGDTRTEPIRQRTGLILGRKQTVGFKYHVGMQLGLCAGEIDEVSRIWMGDKEIFSGSLTHEGVASIYLPELWGGDELGGGGIAGPIRLHDGNALQAVDAYLAAKQAGPATAYRGQAYLVLEQFYIGKSAVPQPVNAEVAHFRRGLLDLGLPGYGSGHHVISSHLSNPMEVLYAWASDPDWGLGLLPNQIDSAAMAAAAETLWSEGNGMAFVVDSQIEGDELKRMIEEQVDGAVFTSRRTGKLTVRLARNDYTLGDTPLLGVDQVIEIREFSKPTWEGTVNQVKLGFFDRAQNYKQTAAPASDPANRAMQGGEIVVADPLYKAVTDASLAAKLAARELRFLSLPLARATVRVTREHWDLEPAQVVRLDFPDEGISALPMRVTRVDFGDFENGAVELGLIEDVFTSEAAITGPNAPAWVAPAQGVADVPSGERVIMEAPRRVVELDPEHPGRPSRVLFGARRQAAEASFRAYIRHHPTSPSGAYTLEGEAFGLVLVGELQSSLSAGGTNPATTMAIVGDPDSATLLDLAFGEAATAAQVGQELAHLLLVDDEFMGALSTGTPVANVTTLATVYRGLMDTVPSDHAAGAPVYLLFTGAGLTDTQLPVGDLVDVQLRGRSQTAELAEGSATTVQIEMEDRYRRPYPPVELELNAVRFDPVVSLDAQRPATSGLDNRGIDLHFDRRDFRRGDEVESLLNDAETLDPGFPAANTTQHRAVASELDGTPAVVYTGPWTTGRNLFVPRTAVLAATDGVLPTDMRVDVETRHTVDGDVLTSRVPLRWDFEREAGALDNDHNLGALSNGESSTTFVAPATGTYTINIGVAIGGDVEVNVNGAGFVVEIATGLTTGSFTANVGESIVVRHQDAGTPLTFLEVLAPSGTVNAYGVLVD